ncbi:MAG: hydroxyacylglutathione hydrolase [Cyanobacteriota bacterium]
MQIHRLPALSDNYIFVLHFPETQQAAVVDPAEAEPVLEYLFGLEAQLVAILNTHHHRDHVGGNLALLQRFPDAVVYGGAEDRGRIPGQQQFLKEGDRIVLGDRPADILFVPGHTRAHIAYYFPPASPEQLGDLFCGDTLFAGGCGRLFEGTPAQMVHSLAKLRALPDSTNIWCAHEYTLKNLQFALSVDPENQTLRLRYQETLHQRQLQQPTVPSRLDIEKQTNPFLRWDVPALLSAMNTQDAVQSFARLRGKKDMW